jgi:dolichol-phosphate mannosyltransferase
LISSGGTWVVLPAYNEAPMLPLLLDTLAQLATKWRRHASSPLRRLQVAVVDDGSTDGTAPAARAFADRLPLKVLAHAQNAGLGAALRTGIEHACRAAAPGDVIVTMDADNTHRPEQIPDLVDAIAGGADIVIASRYARGARQAGVPRHREILSAGVSRLLRWRYGLPGVRDYSCGYRAYRAALLQQALAAYGDRLITSQGFAASTELLTKLAAFSPRVVEIPLDLRYDFKVGPSKMPTARTVAAYLRLLCAPRLRPRV